MDSDSTSSSPLLLTALCAASPTPLPGEGPGWSPRRRKDEELEEGSELYLRELDHAHRLLQLLMAISSAVESAMYAFIFEWTPALSHAGRTPPHGLVFACFMLCYMMGSNAFSWLRGRNVEAGDALPVDEEPSHTVECEHPLFRVLRVRLAPGAKTRRRMVV